MRRLLRGRGRVGRAGAILLALAVLALTSGGVVVRAALPTGFPTTRIKLDPAMQEVNLAPATVAPSATTATLTATVVDWRNAPIAGIKVQLAVLSGPDAGKTVSAQTNASGQAALSLKNSGGPGTDVVQATFSDGLELHKSNRPFVSWLSGPPARAIASPATITLTPDCYQPLSAAALSSDSFVGVAPLPGPTPSPGASPTPAPPTTYAISVTGDYFNPFTAVLVTFDAGVGGHPESFRTKTDGFGHFSVPINPTFRPEGPHLVRGDDFREREATATFKVPCFQPSLALNPAIGPPGDVPIAYGAGYPPHSPIVLMDWNGGITASVLCLDATGNVKLDSVGTPQANLVTNNDGTFQCEVLVLYHDTLGPRYLRAVVPNPEGPDAGAGIEADAPFFVTPGRQQPPDFSYRR